MNLDEKNKSIHSREDFVSFVKALRIDLAENPHAWTNSNLGSFLEALSAWVEDMDGFYLNQGKPVPAQPDWRIMGDILMAAKIYE